ncbi:hypothetical protein HYY69_04555 [Candidatus Woesearchaeota archaeon]|nr:hypothetical protein [Candidatus Woesearchaeota archaeon]
MMVTWKWEFQRNMDIIKRLGFAPSFAEFTGICAYTSRNGNINFYWNVEGADKKSLALVEAIKADSSFTENWVHDLNKKAEQWKKFTETIYLTNLTNPAKLSDTELFTFYQQFLDLHPQIASFAAWIRIIIHQGVLTFEKILKEKIKDEAEYKNALTVLTSTPKQSFNGEEEEAFLELAFNILNKEQNFEELNELSQPSLALLTKHRNNYCWIPCGYYDEPAHDLDYYFHRLLRVKKDRVHSRQALSTLQELSELIEQKQYVLLQNLKLSKEALRLMECLQECVYYKDYVRGVLNKGYYLCYPLFEELGKRVKLSMLDVKFLLEEEYEQALFSKTDFTALISKRKKFHIMVVEKGKPIKLMYGKEAEQLVQEIEGKLDDVKEIKGMSASPGYAKARVRILKNPADIQNETHDFILVASMTTPEFIVAMQKALAIVTDEGGITCHAAIVAREMNKPCVIGTKLASKVLKDGMIVEVDADRGIIKIVS